ncbi:MAG: PD-(D/E)XK nuclease family protein [Terrimicrobiaceae bacterium]|jgi:hypothetical protein|nr:PD-(D/E)XK nuclease family protein [Terrimicrobiaceae bacterium]
MKLKQQDRKHSRISPSKLKPLQICPGWENIEGDSTASLRGTFLHEIMETGEIPKVVPENVTEDDLKMAKEMLVFLREEEKLSPFEPISEMELDFTPLGLEHFEKGHLDRVLILEVDEDENPKKAELTDFKFGEWEVEPVKDNIQFRSYGLGLFLEIPTLQEVVLRLKQPALNKDETHVLRRTPDFNIIKTQLGAIIKRRHKYLETRDAAMLKSDEDNCNFCAMQATCPVWQAYMVRLANESNLFEVPVVTISALDDPESADPDEVLRVFRWIKPMEEYLTKLKRFALAVYDTGRLGDGLNLVEKAGKPAIADPLAVYDLLKAKGVTKEEFILACTVSTTAIKNLVEDKTKKGEKGKAADEFVALLKEEGLMTNGEPSRYLQLSRKKKV